MSKKMVKCSLETQNLVLYGRCGVCHEPRFVDRLTYKVGGRTKTTIRLTCPNGHEQ